MRLLVTGGTGYIGSHTVVALHEQGHDVVILDNLVNSDVSVVDRLEQITGKRLMFVEGNVGNAALVESTLKEYQIEAVVHLAALKAVGESVEKPLLYYQNNVAGTLSLLSAMQSAKVKTIIFSSSATVYGTPSELPLTETSVAGRGITNPCGRSKHICEQILTDMAMADPAWQITVLRYFNPIGAHESGLIGENPKGIPNNLLPYVVQVAAGLRKELHIFGNDYDTPDGTGVRDYIHVVDLARGHVAALEHVLPGTHIYNLGTGQDTSVLELVHAFEKATNITIPYSFAPRRAGDVASCYADTGVAQRMLGWKALKTIEEACADAWRWQQQAADTFKKVL